jgi:hypothetical protein
MFVSVLSDGDRTAPRIDLIMYDSAVFKAKSMNRPAVVE